MRIVQSAVVDGRLDDLAWQTAHPSAHFGRTIRFRASSPRSSPRCESSMTCAALHRRHHACSETAQIRTSALRRDNTLESDDTLPSRWTRTTITVTPPVPHQSPRDALRRAGEKRVAEPPTGAWFSADKRLRVGAHTIVLRRSIVSHVSGSRHSGSTDRPSKEIPPQFMAGMLAFRRCAAVARPSLSRGVDSDVISCGAASLAAECRRTSR